jgi:FkbM family methyltransferase
MLGILLLLETSSAGLELKDLPATAKRVWLDIGSNVHGVAPPEEESVIVIAFEPLVHANISRRRRLYVVPAAVSDESGLTTMITYNSGLSGSLGAPSKQAPWNDPSRGELQTVVVPVVTMASVLASVRSSLNIVYLKTDVQGFDATVLRAAGPALRRVQYIQSEVWLSCAGPLYQTAVPPSAGGPHAQPSPQRCLNLIPELSAAATVHITRAYFACSGACTAMTAQEMTTVSTCSH